MEYVVYDMDKDKPLQTIPINDYINNSKNPGNAIEFDVLKDNYRIVADYDKDGNIVAQTLLELK